MRTDTLLFVVPLHFTKPIWHISDFAQFFVSVSFALNSTRLGRSLLKTLVWPLLHFAWVLECTPGWLHWGEHQVKPCVPFGGGVAWCPSPSQHVVYASALSGAFFWYHKLCSRQAATWDEVFRKVSCCSSNTPLTHIPLNPCSAIIREFHTATSLCRLQLFWLLLDTSIGLLNCLLRQYLWEQPSEQGRPLATGFMHL